MPIDLPDGSHVFIDANIFIYHFSGPTEFTNHCAHFLQRIEDARLSGFTSTLVLAETLHRLMIIEAVSTLQLEPKTAIRHLKGHPSDVKKLVQHLTAPQTVQAIGIQILPLEVADVHNSHDIKKAYGLLTNDALNLAIMRHHRLTCIATNDADFERVNDLLVWKPV